jgi:Cholesterol oxidase, substrate-binding
MQPARLRAQAAASPTYGGGQAGCRRRPYDDRTGLDHACDIGSTAPSPGFSRRSLPAPITPEWDVAVWLDILSFPGTPGGNGAY